MNRRGFFKLLGGAAAAVGLAKVMPAAPVAETVASRAPMGLAYHVQNSQVLLFHPAQRAAYEDLYGPALTPGHIDRMKRLVAHRNEGDLRWRA